MNTPVLDILTSGSGKHQTPLTYVWQTIMGNDLKYKFLKQLTGSQIRPDSEVLETDVFSYNYADCTLEHEFTLREEQYNQSKNQLSPNLLSGGSDTLQLQLYTFPELADHINMNILVNNVWSFIPITTSRSLTGHSHHACMLLLNHVEKRVYFFDPNGSSHILCETNKSVKGSLDLAFAGYFGQFQNEYMLEYKYVSHIEWCGTMPSLNDSAANREKYDKGNCLIWCILFAHWLVEFKTTPKETYQVFSDYTPTDRIYMIYNYSIALFEYGKKWGIVTKQHIDQWWAYIAKNKSDYTPAAEGQSRGGFRPVFDINYLQELSKMGNNAILEEVLRSLLKKDRISNIDYLKNVIGTGDAELVQQVLIDMT